LKLKVAVLSLGSRNDPDVTDCGVTIETGGATVVGIDAVRALVAPGVSVSPLETYEDESGYAGRFEVWCVRRHFDDTVLRCLQALPGSRVLSSVG
jgi:hypothetical protein